VTNIKKIIKNFVPSFILEFYYTHKIKKKKYFGHHELDKKIYKYLNYFNGFYVELGANDGLTQSNTYFFEKNLGWNGILIEPIFNKYTQCIKNRSKSNFFYNRACVGFDFKKKKIKMIYSNLMSTIIDDEIINKLDSKKHALSGEKYLSKNEKVNEFFVKTITLNKIFYNTKAPKLMDFLSLDVEGAEIEVLNGIDFTKFNFKYILIESRNNEELIKYFKKRKYLLIKKISKRDLLFKFTKQ
jgi:FkbM family methyltransferase